MVCVASHAESIEASASMTGIITIRPARGGEKRRKIKTVRRSDETALVIACRQNWTDPLIRAVYERTFYRTEERVKECVRLTVGHAGIIKRPFELVPALILLNVRSDRR